MVAPIHDATQNYVVAPVLESDINPAGIAVADLVPDAAITDADGSAVEAIAIEHLDTSLGRWEYSRDQGLTWISIRADLINSTTNTLALLLGPMHRIRMVPNGNLNGTLANAITFRAWDMSTGTPGSYVVTTPGEGAFSVKSDSAEIAVIAVNDAPTFTSIGGNGMVVLPVGELDDHAQSITLQADGKIIVAGSSFNGSDTDFSIIRLNVDGSLDTSFAEDGKAIVPVGISEDSAFSVAVQPDGKIIVAGRSDDGIGGIDFRIVRLNTDGSPDVSFGTEGTRLISVGSSEDVALGIAVQPDGRLIIVGTSISNGNYDFSVVRLENDGSEDAAFGVDGKIIIPVGDSDDYARSVTVQADGNIIVAGLTTNAENFNYDLGLVRLNPDGSLDNNFGIDGKVIIPVGAIDSASLEIAVQLDGKIIIGGYHSKGAGYDLRLFRLNDDGTMDASFSYGGTVTIPDGLFDDITLKIAIQPDGRLLLVGDKQVDGNHDFAVIRLNADGSIDHTFNGSSFDTLGGTVVYRENAEAIVLDSSVQVLDVDLAVLNSGAGNYHGASITLQRQGGANSEDVFSASGNLVFDLQNRVVLSGVDIGSYIIAPGTLALTFKANATQAQVNEALSSIGYANSSEAPTSSITIAWSFSDGNAGAHGEGGALTAFGTTTVNVTAVNDTPLGLVTISARAAEDLALTADTTGLSDADGLGTLHYQWQASLDGQTWATVGFDSATFTPRGAQVGLRIRVAVSYTDGQGFSETAISNATTPTEGVADVNDAPNITSNGGAGSALLTVQENNYAVTTVTATDPDLEANLKYSIVGGEDSALFQIDQTTGVLTFLTAPNFEAPNDVGRNNRYGVIVQVSDGELSDTQAIEVLVTNQSSETIVGTSFDDVFIASADSELFDGALGIDTVSYVNAASGINVSLASPTTNTGIATQDQYNSIEALIGSLFNDTLTGDTNDNWLIGGLGADSLSGLAGNDRLEGGNGNDSLNGGNGDDLLIGGAGNDLLTGGVGIDTASYEDAATGVTVSLALTTAQNTGGAGTDTLTQIENLIGSAFNDILTGGAGANRIDGGVGNDLFIVATAADHTADEAIIGGAGVDELRFIATAVGTLTLSANTSGIERIIVGTGTGVTAASNATTAINVNASALAAAVAITGNNGANILTGGTGADTLIGNVGADTLDGGAGADSLNGGASNDTYIVDNIGDLITELLGGGTDLVQVAIATEGGSYTLADQVENLSLISTVSFSLTGNTAANVITGNAAANILDGDAGVDTLLGGGGSDLYIVDLTAAGALQDLVTEAAVAGIDTIRLRGTSTNTTTTTITIGQNVENLDASGTGRSLLNLSGNVAANTIVGNAAANLIVGGALGDTMDGRDGSDIYSIFTFADYSDDVINDTGVGATDVDELRIAATVAGTLTVSANTSGLERIVIGTGTGVTAATNARTAISVNASSLNNATVIVGNAGANNLTGGSGSDTLDGGLGIDTLFGGAGADMFVFSATPNANANRDTITDFSALEDSIALENAIFTALGLNTGVLGVAAFRLGAAAADADDRIIYNSANGSLIYDSNGNGAGNAIQIATLSTGLGLTANHFIIV